MQGIIAGMGLSRLQAITRDVPQSRIDCGSLELKKFYACLNKFLGLFNDDPLRPGGIWC